MGKHPADSYSDSGDNVISKGKGKGKGKGKVKVKGKR
jgi:hypothetical protein